MAVEINSATAAPVSRTGNNHQKNRHADEQTRTCTIVAIPGRPDAMKPCSSTCASPASTTSPTKSGKMRAAGAKAGAVEGGNQRPAGDTTPSPSAALNSALSRAERAMAARSCRGSRPTSVGNASSATDP